MNPRQMNVSMLAAERHAYAPYIDGLRAIAVLAVIIYHLHAQWLPGGLAGVDIFFVISGFVVSASVGGLSSVSLPRFMLYFYARRVQRIAPALIVCLVATALVSVLFIPSAWLSDTNSKTGLFAFFGLSNLVLAKTGNDYFSPRVEFNPYMHTWSLGVEEQFYLIFPILFFLWVSHRPQKKRALAVFGGGLVASLICAKWLSVNHETLAFYLIFSRFWELAAGVLLYQALALSGRPFGVADRGATVFTSGAALLSLALVGTGLVFSTPTSFPFPGALLPVVGTLGLLAFLHGRRTDGVLHRVLASRGVVFVGKISYSLYLWHWPVIVLMRWTTGVDTPALKAVAAVSTFALATASYYFVENPIRRAPRLRQWPRAAVVGSGFAAVVFGAALTFGLYHAQPRLSLSVVAHQADDWYPYGSLNQRYAGCSEKWDARKLDDGPVWTYSRVGCDVPAQYTSRLFVIGDSHAMAYSLMFRELALHTGVEVLSYNNGGCAFIGFLPVASADVERCKAYDDDAFAEILEKVRPGDVVFMPSLRLPRFSDQFARFDDRAAHDAMFSDASLEQRHAGEQEAIRQLGELTAKGAKVVLEAPEPVFKMPAFRCADWFNRNNPICTPGSQVTRGDIEAYRAPVLESYARIAQAVPSVSVWDPLPILCPDAVCSMHADGVPLFFDGDHISGYANRLLAPHFQQFIAALMDAPRPGVRPLTVSAHPAQ
ncbi:acyltransferase family protein [Paraburkholderia rhizosphaerae]|uniref:Peptidoglycan/LPS O-acetylase OafA/YrhL n=1 Tax=Paraburkholderia rhizosphaerae TaxID=480658 RepID=A0A4R8LKK0_9BURK|nr:acyltransferase family protein [Paraburkholderia rhizosphaerae]TDY42902.1 peptidoglycan/LPS O-acetylase OafA/YrhL [Paraburkholderia rhizosphaerae]